MARDVHPSIELRMIGMEEGDSCHVCVSYLQS